MFKAAALIQIHTASLRNMEVQIGQLAIEMKSKPRGVLLSDTEQPKGDGKENCKALTLQSCRALPQAHQKKGDSEGGIARPGVSEKGEQATLTVDLEGNELR